MTKVDELMTSWCPQHRVVGLCSAKRHTLLRIAECTHVHMIKWESERCEKVEEECGQAVKIAFATRTVPMKMFFPKWHNTVRAWAKRSNVFACVTRAKWGVLFTPSVAYKGIAISCRSRWLPPVPSLLVFPFWTVTSLMTGENWRIGLLIE